MKPPVYLSRIEAAARIGVTPGTLATWVTQPPPGPRLPRTREGRAVKYLESDVEAFILARRRVIA